MGRVNFDTDSYAYQQDQRKLTRYRNPYKHPDTLAVADAHFDGATSYTEQFIPTRVINTDFHHLDKVDTCTESDANWCSLTEVLASLKKLKAQDKQEVCAILC